MENEELLKNVKDIDRWARALGDATLKAREAEAVLVIDATAGAWVVSIVRGAEQLATGRGKTLEEALQACLT